MNIIPREQWNARAPRSVETTDWNHRTVFVVHYSGANPDQTVRAIQDYHMDTRGWSDIGYNFIVDRHGRIYEGRGWLTIGAHAKGHNTEGIGVCVIGVDHPGVVDVTPEIRTAVRWLYDEANSRRWHAIGFNAPRLTMAGHRDMSGASTDCPGDELHAWVHAGMPATTPTPTPTPTPAPSGSSSLEAALMNLPTLRKGATGRAVRLVQWLLNTIGQASLIEDGVWGDRTDAAVRRFESLNHIPHSVTAAGDGDGVWGPACWTYALDRVR